MGRMEKSQGLAPPAIRKDTRAKQARHIVNKVVPEILASNARARNGAEESELIIDPPARGGLRDNVTVEKENHEEREAAKYVKRKGQGRRKVQQVEEDEEDRRPRKGKRNNEKRKDNSLHEMTSTLSNTLGDNALSATHPKLKVVITDTLTAAHMLTVPAKYTSPAGSAQPKLRDNKKKETNVCILNMASPLRPGGGVLSGATSQEEFICARTTLLPSLKESFYRLPDVGGVYTHDVLVFRNSGQLGDASGDLGSGERWWIDVISAAMLRFPELEGEAGEMRLEKKDREMVERKMRAVLRIARSKRVKRLVLGAWGCGAYGNPVSDIAGAWSRVLQWSSTSSTNKKNGKTETSESWEGLEEIVFAITNSRMAREFTEHFDGHIILEAGSGGRAENEEVDEADVVTEELRGKIAEMESQIQSVWNPDLKVRMEIILNGLKKKLSDREAGNDEEGTEGGVYIGSAKKHENEDSGSEGESSEQDGDEEGEGDDPEGGEGGGLHLSERE